MSEKSRAAKYERERLRGQAHPIPLGRVRSPEELNLPPAPVSWKPEVFVENQWCGNALRFATKAEAEASGRELLSRWFVPTDSRAAESDDPVNYKMVNGRPEGIES